MKYRDNKITEKRDNERVELTGYLVKTIDIPLNSPVIVRDVSMEGLRLIRVPSKFAYRESPTVIIVSGNRLSECYKLTIMPCWRKKNALYWDVGFYIYRAPVSWKRFVKIKKMQAKKNRGVLGSL
ncbi:MAG: hypothetical protein Q3M30_11240 [Candidatus Electrothrix sp. Rat3]|nr:hypothetical protein [Candidatus Electrothrix rattekaaiensis]